jgi:peptide deformylase
MQIVPVDEIPDVVMDTPTNDLVKLHRVCEEMKDVCIAGDGIGLAAVQVGIPWKLFIVNHGVEGWECLINCKYYPLNPRLKGNTGEGGVEYDMLDSIEGCLSLKDEQGEPAIYTVDRFHRVLVEGFELTEWPDLQLQKVHFGTKEGDIYNIVYQHEIDHHNGILISDKGKALCQ